MPLTKVPPQMTSAGVPAFSAYIGNAQTIPAGVDTKVAFNTENFDTSNCYDTSTYRFTPTVAGKYQVNIAAQIGATIQGYVMVYKNGAPHKYGYFGAQATSPVFTLSALVMMNGTTDYIEAYIYASSSGNTSASATLSYFDGFLAVPA